MVRTLCAWERALRLARLRQARGRDRLSARAHELRRVWGLLTKRLCACARAHWRLEAVAWERGQQLSCADALWQPSISEKEVWQRVALVVVRLALRHLLQLAPLSADSES